MILDDDGFIEGLDVRFQGAAKRRASLIHHDMHRQLLGVRGTYAPVNPDSGPRAVYQSTTPEPALGALQAGIVGGPLVIAVGGWFGSEAVRGLSANSSQVTTRSRGRVTITLVPVGSTFSIVMSPL